MSVIRYLIRGMLRANGDKVAGRRFGVVVTPAKYKTVNGQRRKVIPAQGYTRRQRSKDRATSIFLSDVKRKNLAAKKAAATQKQRKNKVVQFLRARV